MGKDEMLRFVYIRPSQNKLSYMKRIFTLLCSYAALSCAQGQIVISQVYGGGGNAGATFTNDFIELHNIGTTTINIANYAVHYASSSGSSWQVTVLTTNTFNLVPGQFFLIQEAAGNGGTTTLPTPDAAGNIPMSATAGKVILTNNSATIGSSTCPSGSNIVDFVTYNGNCSNPGPSLSVTTSALRVDNTGNNTNDFITAAPNPRNSSTIILPLHLLSFTATTKNNNVEVAWKTSNEVNTRHFEVEQSSDGKNFKAFATIAAAGNSTSEKSYSYTTTLNAVTTYYRLKMVDADGKFTTSAVVKVAPAKNGFALGNVYPVPAKNSLTVEWNSSRAGTTSLVLTDMSGRVLKTISTQAVQGFNRQVLDVQTLVAGQYFLQVKNETGKVQTIITKQ